MKGQSIAIYIIIIVTMSLIYISWISVGPFGGGDTAEASFSAPVHTMDNALTGAHLYTSTALRYSLHQACHDVLEDIDFAATTETDFLYDLKDNVKKHMSSYTRESYEFLDQHKVVLPSYGFIDIIPSPLPEDAPPSQYNVEVLYEFPSGLLPPDKVFNEQEITALVSRVRESGQADSVADIALYRSFSRNRELLDPDLTSIDHIYVTLFSNPPTDGQKLIASAIVADALSKFKPSFIEDHVNRIIIQDDTEVVVSGTYTHKNTLYTGRAIHNLKSLSTPQGDIIINYDVLVRDGHKAIYRELANIISLKKFSPQDWMTDTGITTLLSTNPQAVFFLNRQMGLPDREQYYISEDVYTQQYGTTRRPVTVAGPSSLTGPREDFADIAAILLTGGQELQTLRTLADQEEQTGGVAVLNNKLRKAEEQINKNSIMLRFLEKIQTILDFYLRGTGFNLTAFGSEKLSIVASQRADPEHSYSHLLVRAFASENHVIATEDESISITLERNASVEESITTDCYRIFVLGQVISSDFADNLRNSLDQAFQNLPGKNSAGTVPEDSTEENSCDRLFSQLTGKERTESETTFRESVQTLVQGLQPPQGYSLEAELVRNSVAITSELISSVSSTGGKTVTCDFGQEGGVSVKITLTTTDPAQTFPVAEDGQTLFAPLTTTFTITVDSADSQE